MKDQPTDCLPDWVIDWLNDQETDRRTRWLTDFYVLIDPYSSILVIFLFADGGVLWEPSDQPSNYLVHYM